MECCEYCNRGCKNYKLNRLFVMTKKGFLTKMHHHSVTYSWPSRVTLLSTNKKAWVKTALFKIFTDYRGRHWKGVTINHATRVNLK